MESLFSDLPGLSLSSVSGAETILFQSGINRISDFELVVFLPHVYGLFAFFFF